MGTSSTDEDRGLLQGNYSSDEELITTPPRQETELLNPRLNTDSIPSSDPLETRQSPRTSYRVRFDLPPTENDVTPSSLPPPYSDSLSNDHNASALHSPILGNGETSLALFNDHRDGHDDNNILAFAEREHRRPKSGLGSAFMNMTNSIIGAGIIGQPYAFRQAGLVAGIILLIMLTVMVDWTIGLIVINSKLSGSHSFQGTMENCFGRKGLITISLAQWAFAFGGMVAYGIIVGDTIPHVIFALWPGIVNVAGLKLLTDRRFIIISLISGISYPLSMYRDISKVCFFLSVNVSNFRGMTKKRIFQANF